MLNPHQMKIKAEDTKPSPSIGSRISSSVYLGIGVDTGSRTRQ
jgi:hypothetical protein